MENKPEKLPDTKKTSRNLVKLPKIFDYNFSDYNESKSWRSANEDITDYFNYGFNEETWRIYSEKTKAYFAKIQVEKSNRNTNLLIDKDLPMDLGGFGDQVNQDLKSSELFLSMTENLDRFWLSTDLSDAGKFWKNFETVLNENTNSFDLMTQNTSMQNFNFNKYYKFLRQFEKDQEVNLDGVLSKANLRSLKEKISGIAQQQGGNSKMSNVRGNERLETGFRQFLFAQTGVPGKINEPSLGKRTDNPEGEKGLEQIKIVKQN